MDADRIAGDAEVSENERRRAVIKALMDKAKEKQTPASEQIARFFNPQDPIKPTGLNGAYKIWGVRG